MVSHNATSRPDLDVLPRDSGFLHDSWSWKQTIQQVEWMVLHLCGVENFNWSTFANTFGLKIWITGPQQQ